MSTTMTNNDKPLWQLTVEEFREVIKDEIQRSIPKTEKTHANPYAYGIDGIAEIFGCSKASAQTIKSSGRIDEAITQVGRTIVVDRQKALELARKPLKVKHNYITRKQAI